MRTSIPITIILFLLSCSVSKPTKTLHPYTGQQLGCGNFIAYKLSEDNNEYISISFNASNVELGAKQSYGIGKASIVEVKRKKYEGRIDQSLCNDVMMDKPDIIIEELATGGIVEILIRDEEIEKSKNNEPYNVTIILRDVTFEGSVVDYLRIEKINVGWLPG
ncbi:hypothetical protein [Ekhidna sp.]|uniref:hypothetical protein n=1 Tax=Ekhidna sp. TaxID=2608089 RepID=UPI003B50A11F